MIVPSTRYYCNGRYPPSGDIGGSHWSCWTPYGHGSPELATALAQSCDVYFYNVGYAFYNRAGTELADWAVRLGLGKPTGLDVPGEVAGRVPTPEWREEYFEDEIDKIWKPGNSILLSIGQGDLEVTPLQMAVAYAAIANGGTVVQPHLGLKVVSPEGKLVRKIDAKSKKLDISEMTLDAVREGLRVGGDRGHLGRGLQLVPGRRRRQDGHGRGLRQGRLRLVRELRAGGRPALRRRRAHRAGRPRRHGGGAGGAHDLRRALPPRHRPGDRRDEHRLTDGRPLVPASPRLHAPAGDAAR